MIYIITAMYWEAEPFIKYLGLKRDVDSTKFQVFKNDEFILIISGVGPISSAVATTYLLTMYKAENSDLFFNIGVCGCKDDKIEIGSVFLCHKVINNTTNRKFYTDMLFKHPFREGVLETFSTVVNKDFYIQGDLIDMEGAGAFEAASYFLPPHRIYCIKIISDYLKSDEIKGAKISKIINEKMPLIINWIMEVKKALKPLPKVLSKDEEKRLKIISDNLNLTTTMRYEFKKLAQKYKVRRGNLLDVLNSFINVECKTKKEGKMYFEKIKRQLCTT
ncbi:Phosphorylase superfamily protein [Caminicella sporogenes DSM 14501]|uniref:Phosphorylase superfamily protein n=1 Tax=Caminicella sporogenes DSM 14501 TaxID=1121266 RepID=A0A1M6P3J1_9FIRM|nr:hypothetical protein [Caminicella sporogenes]RKD21544.1 hypothetical protein BET04_07400 [Caminicella sporogenes]SHK02452.1 Phosphorylase superfamily protein [Caminicella sporogenes DSM 14501]